MRTVTWMRMGTGTGTPWRSPAPSAKRRGQWLPGHPVDGTHWHVTVCCGSICDSPSVAVPSPFGSPPLLPIPLPPPCHPVLLPLAFVPPRCPPPSSPLPGSSTHCPLAVPHSTPQHPCNAPVVPCTPQVPQAPDKSPRPVNSVGPTVTAAQAQARAVDVGVSWAAGCPICGSGWEGRRSGSSAHPICSPPPRQ